MKKVTYVKFYINVMENNWEWKNAEMVRNTENIDEAIKFIESCDYTKFEDYNWI